MLWTTFSSRSTFFAYSSTRSIPSMFFNCMGTQRTSLNLILSIEKPNLKFETWKNLFQIRNWSNPKIKNRKNWQFFFFLYLSLNNLVDWISNGYEIMVSTSYGSAALPRTKIEPRARRPGLSPPRRSSTLHTDEFRYLYVYKITRGEAAGGSRILFTSVSRTSARVWKSVYRI